jgi:hypothetical protein
MTIYLFIRTLNTWAMFIYILELYFINGKIISYRTDLINNSVNHSAGNSPVQEQLLE